MEIIRVFASFTGFDELYEGYLKSQMERLIEDVTNNEGADRKEVVS